MKKFLGILLGFLFAISTLIGQNLKPYTIGEQLNMGMTEAKEFVKTALVKNDFEILGSYQVADDKNRYLYVITSEELKSIVNKLGGKRGFLSTLRVAITIEDNKAIVSYTTPEYWANAYLQSSYSSVSASVKGLKTRFINVFSLNTPFGSESGHSAKKLQSYHYMIGMPYFEDDVELKSFLDFNTAIDEIDKNISTNLKLEKVYEISFPNKEIKLYGIGLSEESTFLPIIDNSFPKHTAFLPYEILVYKNKAYMLHGRYRIALSFPDLTMGTFMKIMSTPGDIEKAMKEACQ